MEEEGAGGGGGLSRAAGTALHCLLEEGTQAFLCLLLVPCTELW